MYPSVQEKAANLLYFIVKDHPFIDGCKRIAASIFLYFLNKNNLLFKNDKKIIEDEALEAKISKTVAAYLKDNIKENKESYSNRPFIEIAEEYFRNPNINKNDKRDTLDKINKIFYSL